MTDITDMLRRKGTIEGLTALNERGELSHGEMKEQMGVSNGTIQERLTELKSHNLIDEDADVGDSGRPKKVYRLTEDGSERAEKLQEIIE